MKRVLESADWARILIPLLFGVALALYPTSFQAAKALERGKVAETDQRPALAATQLSGAAGALPWRADLWERAGIDALEGGDSAAAIPDLERARKEGQLSLQGWLALGDAYQKQGDLAAGLATWETRASLGGGSKELFERLVDGYDQQGDLEMAVQALRRWKASEPDQAEVLYQLGLHEAVIHPGDAGVILSQAVAADSSLAEKTRTIQTALNVASLEDDAAYKLLIIGRSLASLGDWKLAAETFRRGTLARPDYAEVWAFLGEARQHLGKDGQAELTRAEVLNPDSVLVQALKALYWQRQGKPARAVDSLTKVAGIEPENPTWQLELGNALAALGKLNQALEHYQNAVRLAPVDPFYWRALAGFCVDFNVEMKTVGLPAASQAVALDPNDPSGLDLIGEIFLKTSDTLSAERFLQRSLQASPDYAPAHYHLGFLFLQAGKTSEAYQHLSRAAQLAAGQPLGKQAQRLIDQYFR
ncbi:MAG TPA: tetratricopeptide repeat protein [Anaerolineaceae bacterium]|nr:tetratricopeptide repeat protein [Anaerolineaceae bacterium]